MFQSQEPGGSAGSGGGLPTLDVMDDLKSLVLVLSLVQERIHLQTLVSIKGSDGPGKDPLHILGLSLDQLSSISEHAQ